MIDRQLRAELIRKGLTVSLVGSVVIAIGKIGYGYSSKSLAFAADGVHSLFDSASTLAGLVSTFWSAKPPDDGHPYGHQKFETVCVVGLSVVLAIAGYEIAVRAYEKIVAGTAAAPFRWEALAVLGVALLINHFVSRYQLKLAKEAKSRLLQADAVHNQSDFWVTAAVVVSVAGAPLSLAWLDPLISIGIAIYLVVFAVRILWGALRPLVDASVLDPDEVRKVVEQIPGVLFCHAVRTRGELDHLFLDLNIHLPGAIPLVRAHEIAHAVEARLKDAFPGLVDVVVHTEPHGHPPCDAVPPG